MQHTVQYTVLSVYSSVTVPSAKGGSGSSRRSILSTYATSLLPLPLWHLGTELYTVLKTVTGLYTEYICSSISTQDHCTEYPEYIYYFATALPLPPWH